VSVRRRLAARLALMIECAGRVPEIAGSGYREYCRSLETQYLSIERTVRRRARVEARRLIREIGLRGVAARLIPVPSSSNSDTRKIRTAAIFEQAMEKIKQWPKETPPCPHCRMFAGLPKKSYPSREIADEVRRQQRDPSLFTYPCPTRPGSWWHLGHRRGKQSRPPLA
jgi:hypothetical protein